MGSQTSEKTVHKVRVWDFPTRFFHWSAAALVFAMAGTGLTGGSAMRWHLPMGLALLALLLARVAWGFFGSETARFSDFVKGPKQIKRYLKHEMTEAEQPGHNPLGALEVVALIAVLLIQVCSGLFSADVNTYIYNGYLAGWIDSSTAEKVTLFHSRLFLLLAALVILHICAIFLYLLARKLNLIAPMFTGRKNIEGAARPLKFEPAAKYWGILAVCAGVAVAIGALS